MGIAANTSLALRFCVSLHSMLVSNPSVGVLFIVPGFDDTLRINGRAFISRDPELLSSMEVNKRLPKLSIVVEIKEVFLHCAKAFRRARIWDFDALQARNQLPSLAAMVTEQTSGVAVDPSDAKKMEQDLEDEYRDTMY